MSKRLYLDSITFREYCVCGAKLVATSSPPDVARLAVRLFWDELHAGLGHGRTTPEQARKARARARREYL